jgi:hypothetical protein
MRGIEPLGREDLEILRLESRRVAGHTLKIAILRPTERARRPDLDTVRRQIAERMSRDPRLRCKLSAADGGRAAAWVEDPAFDVREHMRRLSVSEPVSEPRSAGRRRARDGGAARPRPSAVDPRCPRPHGRRRRLPHLEASPRHGRRRDRAATRRRCPVGFADLRGAPGAASVRAGCPVPPARRGRLGAPPGTAAARAPTPAGPKRRPSPFDGAIGRVRSVAFASVPLGALKRAAKAVVGTATVDDVVLALVGRRPALRLRHARRQRAGQGPGQPAGPIGEPPRREPWIFLRGAPAGGGARPGAAPSPDLRGHGPVQAGR